DLDLVKNDEQGYRKIIIYDNGESRIEFYKKTHPTDQVMLTFDSIYMAWNKPSFGFKLLIRQNLDIIALRKRQKQTYHQDLSKYDYQEPVKPLIGAYRDVIAYGYSLGGYSALYYTPELKCRVLA